MSSGSVSSCLITRRSRPSHWGPLPLAYAAAPFLEMHFTSVGNVPDQKRGALADAVATHGDRSILSAIAHAGTGVYGLYL